MAIWSSVQGTIKIHKSKKTSMEAVFEGHFDEYNVNINTEDCSDCFKHTFFITFSEEGQNAFYTLQGLIKVLSRRGEWLELETYIKWV